MKTNKRNAIIGCSIYLILSLAAVLTRGNGLILALLCVVSLGGMIQAMNIPNPYEPEEEIDANPRIDDDGDRLSGTHVICHACEGYRQMGIQLMDELASAQKEITELKSRLASGIQIKGWWCTKCDIFNGEEKDVYLNCRNCEAPKNSNPRIESA